MARQFLLATQAEIDLQLAESIHSREMELASYDLELVNHLASINSLGPIEWDETTKPYRGLSRDVMIARAITDGKTTADIELIAALDARDNHVMNAEAVRIERGKAGRHYQNLLTNLPVGKRRTDAIAAWVVKQGIIIEPGPVVEPIVEPIVELIVEPGLDINVQGRG